MAWQLSMRYFEIVKVLLDVFGVYNVPNVLKAAEIFGIGQSRQ